MSVGRTVGILLFVKFLCLVQGEFEPIPRDAPWSGASPLRICTASNQDFGSRCNGGRYQSSAPQPLGGWCRDNSDGGFCGYDVDVFRCVYSTFVLLLFGH